MPKLILIKHALPGINPGAPASTWELGGAGLERCEALALTLTEYLPAKLVSSPEPKAAATANALAQTWGIDWVAIPGLEEHHRQTAPFLGADAFRTTIQQLFAHPDQLIFGEETANAAYARFAATLDQLLAQSPDHNVIVVSHGTVIALWASRQIAGIDGFTLWEQLGLPSYLVIDRTTMQIEATLFQLE